MKLPLTLEAMICEAKVFCEQESKKDNATLFGVTDGKAVGTYIEHAFQDFLSEKYEYLRGSSASGIDLPDAVINTDIKVTSAVQPQSSCPFKNARQKIYGLGYNLLLFVYEKNDNPEKKTTLLRCVHCSFIEAKRAADYQMTLSLRQLYANAANTEEIAAYLHDRNLPLDDTSMNVLAEEIAYNPPEQGYITISNALQWRLQYSRVVSLQETVQGIIPIVGEAAR
ncbi:MAG: restriction endonuclease [Candidatus Kapaibacterium sp.]|nr:MAG: restriction endonuclease [Candidatus Kapabacteria bacterium]